MEKSYVEFDKDKRRKCKLCLRSFCNPQGLLEKYNNSLVEILKEVFPGENWEELSQVHSEFQSSKPQRSVQKWSSKWFPDEEISVNFRHPSIEFLSYLF